MTKSIDNDYIYYGAYIHKHFVEDNILITQIKNKQTIGFLDNKD